MEVKIDFIGCFLRESVKILLPPLKNASGSQHQNNSEKVPPVPGEKHIELSGFKNKYTTGLKGRYQRGNFFSS